MSHKLTTSINGDLVITGRYALETLPQPINPVRMRRGEGSPAHPMVKLEASAPLARRVVFPKVRLVTRDDVELGFIL